MLPSAPAVGAARRFSGAHSLAPPHTTAQIAQRQRRFEPAVSAIQTGTAVQFPNLDTVRHHVYSFSPARRFELKLYTGTPAAPVVFDKPGVAVLGCNIHDRMAATVVVMDTPLIAQADAEGRVQFELGPGEHQLLAWLPGWTDATPFAQRAVVQGGGAQKIRWSPKAGAP